MKIVSRWNSEQILLENNLADLRGADLREANLCGADLRGANLCGADLREANLCGANLSFAEGIIRISGSKYEIFATSKAIWCGCVQLEWANWRETYEHIGKVNSYSDEEIREYQIYLFCAEAWFALQKSAQGAAS